MFDEPHVLAHEVLRRLGVEVLHVKVAIKVNVVPVIVVRTAERGLEYTAQGEENEEQDQDDHEDLPGISETRSSMRSSFRSS